jgi:hypothetical protein
VRIPSHKALDVPTLVDCGCKAVVYSDHSGVAIEYCAHHRAAFDLLDTLRFYADKRHYYRRGGSYLPTKIEADKGALARAAIARVEDEG